MKLSGNVWKFGDDLGVCDLLAAKYDNLGVNDQWEECATHLLEELAPDFATQARPGDIIVAGFQLGSGHAHYYRAAIMALKPAKSRASITFDQIAMTLGDFGNIWPESLHLPAETSALVPSK